MAVHFRQKLITQRASSRASSTDHTGSQQWTCTELWIALCEKQYLTGTQQFPPFRVLSLSLSDCGSEDCPTMLETAAWLSDCLTVWKLFGLLSDCFDAKMHMAAVHQ